MLVYRICSLKEIESLQKYKDLTLIGHTKTFSLANNHQYIPNIKYLHFFLNKDSILYLNKNNQYLCTYDIPTKILEKYKGIGYYLDYITFSHLQKVQEYAIPIKELDYSYLIKIEKILKMLDIEDFLEDITLNNYTKIVYQKEDLSLKRTKTNIKKSY